MHTEPLLNSLHGVQWGSRPTENFSWRNVSLSVNWIQEVLLILTQAFQEATWVPTFAKMKPRLSRNTCKHKQKYTHICCGIMSCFKRSAKPVHRWRQNTNQKMEANTYYWNDCTIPNKAPKQKIKDYCMWKNITQKSDLWSTEICPSANYSSVMVYIILVTWFFLHPVNQYGHIRETELLTTVYINMDYISG